MDSLIEELEQILKNEFRVSHEPTVAEFSRGPYSFHIGKSPTQIFPLGSKDVYHESHMGFKMKGSVDGAMSNNYFHDVINSVSELNKTLEKEGIKIDHVVPLNLNGASEAVIYHLSLRYNSNEEPSKVAAAIQLVQHSLERVLSNYARQNLMRVYA